MLFGFMHVGLPLLYILWMRHIALTRPWNVKVDTSYSPKVTVILPTYNESQVISKKLENLLAVEYPRELIDVIVVDSASTDGTVSFAKAFMAQHPTFRMNVLEESERRGKSKALNLAVKIAEGDIFVTTDADTYWDPDVLKIILPYLADPLVGVVTGTEVPLNPDQSLATRSEVAYHAAYEPIRVGESKIHSTLVLNGELSAYKRESFGGFDELSGGDDMGAAIKVAEKGFRCLQVPEAKTYNNVYHTWRGKTTVKVRRAEQMIFLWLLCLRMMIRKRLTLPLAIMVPELYLHLLNPFVGILFCCLGLLTVLQNPVLILPVLVLVALPTTRRYLISFFVHNTFLLIGFLKHIKGDRHVTWTKVQETRATTAFQHR